MDISFELFKSQTLSNTVEIEIDQNENTEYMRVNAQELHARDDLMIGLHPILEDAYQISTN